MQCSIRSSSISTVPYFMKNPITCFQLSPDVQQSIPTPCILFEEWGFTIVLQYNKNANCGSQLLCIEFNVPGTNFSINSYEEKSRALYRVTDRTTLFSRHTVHRTGYSSDDLRGVDGLKNACPPVVYISDLIRVSPHVFQLVEKWSPEKNNNLRTEQTGKKHRQKHEAQATSLPGPNALPRKRQIKLQPRSKAVPSLLFHRGQITCFLRRLSPRLWVCGPAAGK